MFGWSLTAVILGVRMQAAQSSVGKVLSNIAMWPPIDGSRSTRITSLPASARVSAASMPAMPPPTTIARGTIRTNCRCKRLVPGHAADGRGQVGLGLLQGLLLVLGDPGDLLADVGHLHQEAVQAGVLGGAAEGGLVQVRRAGGHHDPVQVELDDVAFDQFLAGIGAHVLVVPGEGHAGQALGELRQRLHVDHAGDVAAAVADVDSDPQRF